MSCLQMHYLWYMANAAARRISAAYCWCALQGSVAVFYNWVKIEHTWVTDLIKDYAAPVSYVGLSTKDRRFIYPQKEVMHTHGWQLHILVLIVKQKQLTTSSPFDEHGLFCGMVWLGPCHSVQKHKSCRPVVCDCMHVRHQ